MINNQGLESALTKQEGEQYPRVIVTQDKRPLTYEEIESKTTQELQSCGITVFGMGVRVHKKKVPHKDEEYLISGGVAGMSMTALEKTPAAQTLEQFYKAQVSLIQGGI